MSACGACGVFTCVFVRILHCGPLSDVRLSYYNACRDPWMLRSGNAVELS